MRKKSNHCNMQQQRSDNTEQDEVSLDNNFTEREWVSRAWTI